jgi:hypothetical protein
MRISGTGITSFQARIQPDYQINTTLAIKWFEVTSGSWRSVDRGSTVDTYETTVRLHGIRGRIEQLVSELYANRAAGSNVVTLSEFNANEKIFGVDVVHTNVAATLLGTPKIAQIALKTFEVEATFRATALTFTGSATVPTLKYLNHGYNANVDEYTINKIDTYTSSYTYQDHVADSGIFEGTFQFTDAELIGLRRYMAVNRGTTAAIAEIYGVTYPFGVIRGGYPKDVKILELRNETLRGIGNWYATLRLAEVV